MLADARARGSTIFHPSGTCVMAPAANPMAVVDHQLRVHGLEAVRVADAGVMPTVVSGNTNAACIMIGEKCGEMMLGAGSGSVEIGGWFGRAPRGQAPISGVFVWSLATAPRLTLNHPRTVSLGVADAGVIPTVVSNNTNAVVPCAAKMR
jgi:hypothetical protein